MYGIGLILHSYTRWLVLITLVCALIQLWHGLLTRRVWTRWDRYVALAVTAVTSIQFLLGLLIFFQPVGLAQVAWRDFSAAMESRELRFFGLEHPLQMFIAIGLIHLGSTRSNKARTDAAKFRWAVICFTLAVLLILAAVPWWRPFFRAF